MTLPLWTPVRCLCLREHRMPVTEDVLTCECGGTWTLAADGVGGFLLLGFGHLDGVVRHLRAEDIAAATYGMVVGV